MQARVNFTNENGRTLRMGPKTPVEPMSNPHPTGTHCISAPEIALAIRDSRMSLTLSTIRGERVTHGLSLALC